MISNTIFFLTGYNFPWAGHQGMGRITSSRIVYGLMGVGKIKNHCLAKFFPVLLIFLVIDVERRKVQASCSYCGSRVSGRSFFGDRPLSTAFQLIIVYCRIAGITAAISLKTKLNFNNFTVFTTIQLVNVLLTYPHFSQIYEQADAVGGTWRVRNRYVAPQYTY